MKNIKYFPNKVLKNIKDSPIRDLNNKPKKIAFLGQKGGIGKSSDARALAVEAELNGIKTLTVDLNYQQKTVWEWYLRRVSNEIEPKLNVEVKRDYREVNSIINNFDLVIYDLAGGTHEDTVKIAEDVDLIIQPTSSSIDDLEPAVKEFNYLKNEKIDPNKLLFLMHRILSPKEIKRIKEYINPTGYQIAKGHIKEKLSFKYATDYGMAINEIDAPRTEKIKNEVKSLMQGILERTGFKIRDEERK